MLDPILMLPDFILIMLGLVLCRYTALQRPVWDVVERLVYWLLFPTLLFSSIVRSPMQPGDAAPLVTGGLLVCVVGIALATALRAWPGVDARLHASGAQVAFRFNSYIALALAGTPGIAWVALLIALCVPLCNVGAVWSLARHGGHSLWKELISNPLILGTVAGLLVKLSGVTLPWWFQESTHRIGQAALPLGLLAVGAGLRLTGLTAAPGLATALLAIRHLVLPALAVPLGSWLGLSLPEHTLLVAFAALPTASSGYVLAVRMGGNGPFVAGLITVSTLLGMASVPLWVAALGHLR